MNTLGLLYIILHGIYTLVVLFYPFSSAKDITLLLLSGQYDPGIDEYNERDPRVSNPRSQGERPPTT